MSKRWIRNKKLTNAYGEPIMVQNYEAPNLGLTDKGPHPQDPSRTIFEVTKTDMDTALAIQHFANSFLNLPLTELQGLTAADLERIQAVLTAAVHCKKNSHNHITLEEKVYDWLLGFFKTDKYALVIARLYGQNAWLVKEALEDLLRPEEREPQTREKEEA